MLKAGGHSVLPILVIVGSQRGVYERQNVLHEGVGVGFFHGLGWPERTRPDPANCRLDRPSYRPIGPRLESVFAEYLRRPAMRQPATGNEPCPSLPRTVRGPTQGQNMAKNGQQAARADVGGQRLPDAPKPKKAAPPKRDKTGSGGAADAAAPNKSSASGGTTDERK